MDKDRKRNIIYIRNLQKRKENAMKIQDKLDLWVKLTNVDPTKEQKSYTINMSGRLSDFDIKRMNDKIKEALKYDATGVFADAYLSEYFEKFIADKNFSVKEMLANPEIENFLADARLLQDALAESNSANMIRSDAEKSNKLLWYVSRRTVSFRYYRSPDICRTLHEREIKHITVFKRYSI